MPTTNSDPADESVALQSAIDNGDEDAAATILEQYRPRIKTMIRARLPPRLRSRVDESDIAQEAIADAVRKFRSYQHREGASPYVWLRRFAGIRLAEVTRHHLGTDKRSAVREEREHAKEHDVSSIWLAERLVDSGTTPSKRAMRAEICDFVRQGLDELEAVDREILFLRHFEQLSTSEAAEVLGLSKAGAGKRYLRAVDRLRELLEQAEQKY